MQNEKREIIQREALIAAADFSRCSLALSMRVGKTKIGLDHINKYYNKQSGNIKVLVVAPKLSIFQTWKDDAAKFKIDHLLKVIKFTTYLSLKKQDLDYDLVIFDECHNLLYTQLPWLKQYEGDILGLTGTPPKYENSEKGKMVNLFCPIKYSYITDDAVDDQILNDYRIIVHLMKLSDKKNIPVKTKSTTFYTSEIESYNYWSRRIDDSTSSKEKQISSVMRMKAMMDYPTKEKYAKDLMNHIEDKCIVFANTRDQADRLCDHSYHSTNSDNEQNLELFKSGMIDKLSCVLQLSEGITIPDLKSAIIMHSYSNERKLAQRLGRCLGLSSDEMAIIHILCFQNTVDELWVQTALEDFDQTKIIYKDFNTVENVL